jgi:hypothetical protein
VFPGFPVGAYPLVNEVLASWAAGISRSQAPALVWTPALIALTAAGGWIALPASTSAASRQGWRARLGAGPPS